MKRGKFMPKQTFHNLEKEKQTKIYNVAFEEFSRVPFHEASIANITKNANISRGSFYQYFEDKFDLFKYVLVTLEKKTMFSSDNIKISKDNDFFDICEKKFIYQLKLVDSEEYHDFFKNIFLNFSYELEKNLYDFKINNEKMFIRFVEKFDLSNFKSKNLKDIQKFMDMIMLVVKRCMLLKMTLEISNDEVMRIYRDYINIIKEGVLNKC